MGPMKRNIPRNRLKDQFGDFMCSGIHRSQPLSNRGGADRLQGPFDRKKAGVMRSASIKLSLIQRGWCAISYANYSGFEILPPFSPLPEGCELIGAPRPPALDALGFKGDSSVQTQSRLTRNSL
ncbi:MAG: hypothetical protein JWP96_2215 [Polaromonas sp.]|nr:hypothetical protein [Polaromonas sp.]